MNSRRTALAYRLVAQPWVQVLQVDFGRGSSCLQVIMPFIGTGIFELGHGLLIIVTVGIEGWLPTATIELN
jgi:hypothetical protein